MRPTIDPNHLPESMKPATSSRRGPFLVLAAVAALMVLYVIVPSAEVGAAATTPGLRGVKAVVPARMDFAIVSDLDKKSLVAGKKPKWRAVLKRGTLLHNNGEYSVEWKDDVELLSGHGEAGRGMELSELVMWDGRLYSIDDRSGIVFEIVDPNGPAPFVAPRFILMEGDGVTDKGFKGEWMSVKDGNLYVGSFGKEYVNPDGNIKNKNNMWIAVLYPDGHKEQLDWTGAYNAMRAKVGLQHPGYMIHEAGQWSDIHKKWFFLPRRMSADAYNEDLDEKKGANSIFVVDPDFAKPSVSTVGHITPERGFSSFKFVPGSKDRVIVALKSAENGAADTQTTYITVFTTDGQQLLAETEVPGAMKFEGLEFL